MHCYAVVSRSTPAIHQSLLVLTLLGGCHQNTILLDLSVHQARKQWILKADCHSAAISLEPNSDSTELEWNLLDCSYQYRAFQCSQVGQAL